MGGLQVNIGLGPSGIQGLQPCWWHVGHDLLAGDIDIGNSQTGKGQRKWE